MQLHRIRTQDSGLKLFIQQNTQNNTKEIASYIEQLFILWYDKDILNIRIIFIHKQGSFCVRGQSMRGGVNM